MCNHCFTVNRYTEYNRWGVHQLCIHTDPKWVRSRFPTMLSINSPACAYIRTFVTVEYRPACIIGHKIFQSTWQQCCFLLMKTRSRLSATATYSYCLSVQLLKHHNYRLASMFGHIFMKKREGIFHILRR